MNKLKARMARLEKGIRDGDKKYVRRNEEGKIDEWLFNLETDSSESNNLLETQPKSPLADGLKQKLIDNVLLLCTHRHA